MAEKSINLKYGCNPHQIPAKIYSSKSELPFDVINGSPGYINFLDALNSWQLVRELKQATNLPAAASFKHVSPAGAAVGTDLSDTLKKVYFVEDIEFTPLASAYVRARGADSLSSFGDWIALSDIVDVPTAMIISKEVSDGIIAPAYEKEALDILMKKKKGKYSIIQIDKDYMPDETEKREVFGITFEQKRNSKPVTYSMLENIVTNNKNLNKEAQRNLIIAMIALKYTQSNSVCFTYDGQVIGCGAGQQSRIHCTRLAGQKADIWYLRQHPSVLNLKFKNEITKPERNNAIDQYLRDDVTAEEIKNWANIFEEIPRRLSTEQKREWLSNLQNVALGSDAFFPFRDNIDRAKQSGVKYIVQPGGSIRDQAVIDACNEYDMIMAFSNFRLFHH